MAKPNLACLTEPLRPTPPVAVPSTKSEAIRLAVAEGYGPTEGVKWIKKTFGMDVSKNTYAYVSYMDRRPGDSPLGTRHGFRPIAPPDDMEAMAAIKLLVQRHGVDFVVRAAKLLEK